MATNIEDETVYFKPISCGFQLSSLSGGSFGGYSIGGAASAARILQPTETNAATIAAFVCTLVKDLMAPKA